MTEIKQSDKITVFFVVVVMLSLVFIITFVVTANYEEFNKFIGNNTFTSSSSSILRHETEKFDLVCSKEDFKPEFTPDRYFRDKYRRDKKVDSVYISLISFIQNNGGNLQNSDFKNKNLNSVFKSKIIIDEREALIDSGDSYKSDPLKIMYQKILEMSVSKFQTLTFIQFLNYFFCGQVYAFDHPDPQIVSEYRAKIFEIYQVNSLAALKEEIGNIIASYQDIEDNEELLKVVYKINYRSETFGFFNYYDLFVELINIIKTKV